MNFSLEDLKPDPNERACVTCKEHFNPYSMAPDHQPVVLPPVNYYCLKCRLAPVPS